MISSTDSILQPRARNGTWGCFPHKRCQQSAILLSPSHIADLVAVSSKPLFTMTRTVFIAICYLFSVVLTHSSRSFSNGDVGDLRLFHLPSQSQYVSSREIVHNTEPYSITSENRSNYLRTATQLVTKVAPNSTFRIVDDHYIGENGIAHVRFRQTLRGVDIGNADFNVNVF